MAIFAVKKTPARSAGAQVRRFENQVSESSISSVLFLTRIYRRKVKKTDSSALPIHKAICQPHPGRPWLADYCSKKSSNTHPSNKHYPAVALLHQLDSGTSRCLSAGLQSEIKFRPMPPEKKGRRKSCWLILALAPDGDRKALALAPDGDRIGIARRCKNIAPNVSTIMMATTKSITPTPKG